MKAITKQYNLDDEPGLVAKVKARSCGVGVSMYCVAQSGVPCGKEHEPWGVMCDHGSILHFHDTLSAKQAMSGPEKFCEKCAEAAVRHSLVKAEAVAASNDPNRVLQVRNPKSLEHLAVNELLHLAPTPTAVTEPIQAPAIDTASAQDALICQNCGSNHTEHCTSCPITTDKEPDVAIELDTATSCFNLAKPVFVPVPASVPAVEPAPIVAASIQFGQVGMVPVSVLIQLKELIDKAIQDAVKNVPAIGTVEVTTSVPAPAPPQVIKSVVDIDGAPIEGMFEIPVVKKHRGRQKGSENKPKVVETTPVTVETVPVVESVPAPAPAPVIEAVVVPTIEDSVKITGKGPVVEIVQGTIKKHRGRPKGSKNHPKIVDIAIPPTFDVPVTVSVTTEAAAVPEPVMEPVVEPMVAVQVISEAIDADVDVVLEEPMGLIFPPRAEVSIRPKPKCKLTGQDKDPYAFAKIVREVLRRDGQAERVPEFSQRFKEEVDSIESAINLIAQYVDIQ